MSTFDLKPAIGMLWPLATSGFSLQGGEAHVWARSLDIPQSELTQLESTLSLEECERAARFRFELHRNRFIAGRGLLRAILGHYLQMDPGKVQFSYGPYGKPSLADTTNKLHFNLAHSEELALIAVAGQGPIGVDVERIRVLDDFDELVSRFFSGREAAAFRKLAPDQKPAAFFNLWTRKEAWLKATGEGISYSLNRVEVTFLPGEPARLLSLPENSSPLANWTLHELSPASGYASAVITSGENTRLKCRH